MLIPQRDELRRKLMNVGWFILGLAIGILLLFLLADYAVRRALTEEVAHSLSWSAAVAVHGRIQSGRLPEATKFKDDAECQAFGKQMAPRLADWVRGMFQLDWRAPIAVGFECRIAGDPA
jgi:hypothetical protein